VIDGARMRDYDVRIGGTLFSDALGADGTYEGTYKGMLETNIKAIINGLK
jgi:manganese/zinc/iron transport system substrate-binding protein